MATGEQLGEELIRRRGAHASLQKTIDRMASERDELQGGLHHHEQAVLLLKKGGHAGRTAMKEAVEPILTAACQTVYPTRSCQVDFPESRGLYDVRLIVEGENGVSGDPRNDIFGGGLRELLALAARVSFVRKRSTSRVLFLDEPLKVLGRLADRGSAFLHACAHDVLDQIIMITHETGFEGEADCVMEAYRVRPNTCRIRVLKRPVEVASADEL